MKSFKKALRPLTESAKIKAIGKIQVYLRGAESAEPMSL
jgi:hypothetical protein